MPSSTSSGDWYRPRRHADLCNPGCCSASAGALRSNRAAYGDDAVLTSSCAGLYPILLHLGRPWLAYFGCFPIREHDEAVAAIRQARSSGIDCAVAPHDSTVSALFWYVGLIPDFATLRDRSTASRCRALQLPDCLRWAGAASTLHWHRRRNRHRWRRGLASAVSSLPRPHDRQLRFRGLHRARVASPLPFPYFVAERISQSHAMRMTRLFLSQRSLRPGRLHYSSSPLARTWPRSCWRRV